MSAAKSKRRFGCLTVFLIFIVIIVLICAGLWVFVLHKGPGKAAREIISGPVDAEASAMVEKALTEKGVAGIKVVVVPLPDSLLAQQGADPDESEGNGDSTPPTVESTSETGGKGRGEQPEDNGNAAILVLDPSNGFKPAAGSEGKRQQALDAIKQLVDTNKNNNLNLQRVGLEYQENGKAIIALTVPIDAMEGLANGKIDDAQFLANVDVKLKDILFIKNLFK